MSAAVLAGALAIDALLGEPPNRLHPVAHIGRLLASGRRALAGRSKTTLLLGGAGGVIALSAAVGLGALMLTRKLEGAGTIGTLIEAAVLSLAFSGRMLITSARAVRDRLAAGDLEGARDRAAMLVSRDTSSLDAQHIASATVETVSENLTDSYVAPLFYYGLFGLAGAWIYRVINTADAMIGYRHGELEFLGKGAARLDDALGFVPARITAGLLIAAAALGGGSARGAWRTTGRDHARTASPNSGWGMAAMAGALGVQLEKPGAYSLGTGPLPSAHDMTRACRIATWTCALTGALALLFS